MIDRFHDFTDKELRTLRYGLVRMAFLCDDKQADILSDEIKHVMDQREMARRREELPG